MARGQETILREGESGIAGRHPAGRHGNRNSAGRHGTKLPADVLEESSEKGAFGRAINAIGTVAGKAGQGAAALLLAAGVGLGIAACDEGGGFKSPDSGMDTDTWGDTDPVDTETEEEGPVCEHHAGPSYDYEAKLAIGEKARLTVEGHEMEIVALDVGNQLAEVLITDGEGNPILNGDSYFVFDGMDSTLTLELGDETIIFTLCWVFEVPENGEAGEEGEGLPPGTYAKLLSNSENGFVHCENPDEYTASESVYTVDENTTQTITKTFYNEGEFGDPECEGVTTDFVMEESAFDAPLPLQDNIPGLADKSVKVRGSILNLIGVSYEGVNLGARLGKKVASANLSENESMEGSDLEVEYKGMGSSNGPDFAFKYPGIDEETDLWVEDKGDHEKAIYVLTESELKVFTLRFGNLNFDGTVDAALLTDVQRLDISSVFVVSGVQYEVGMGVTSATILGWTLTPVE